MRLRCRLTAVIFNTLQSFSKFWFLPPFHYPWHLKSGVPPPPPAPPWVRTQAQYLEQWPSAYELTDARALKKQFDERENKIDKSRNLGWGYLKGLTCFRRSLFSPPHPRRQKKALLTGYEERKVNIETNVNFRCLKMHMQLNFRTQLLRNLRNYKNYTNLKMILMVSSKRQSTLLLLIFTFPFDLKDNWIYKSFVCPRVFNRFLFSLLNTNYREDD